MGKEKIVKFKTHKPNLGILIGFLLVFVITYVCCVYYGNKISIQASNFSDINEKINIQNFCEVLSNFSVVVISVLTTSIISIPLIEIKNKNNFTNELIINDVFSSQDFYKMLTDENRKKILNTIEKEEYFGGDKNKILLYESIRNKLNVNIIKDSLFYNNCNFLITCVIKEDCIEKTIVKTFELMSFSNPQTIREFSLCNGSFKELSGKSNCEVKALKVSGQDWKEFVDIVPGEEPSASDEKCDYDKSCRYICKKVIDVSNKKPVKIEFTYVQRVPINDLTYVCRLRYPCKKMFFKYSISGEKSNDYLISAPAFGFMDDAENTPNEKNKQPVIYREFNDWIFPNDGVAVTMIKK